MFKYALLIGIVLPAAASAADYSGNYSGHSLQGCHREQNGSLYCIESPIEKRIANCNPGEDCHHMQSGQHYSNQYPTIVE